MVYLNFYDLVLNKNLLDYFFLNNYLFYDYFVLNDLSFFIGKNYYSFYFLNFYNFQKYYLIFYSFEIKEAYVSYNTLYTKGYSYTYDYPYILNTYVLNTSGKLRFNSDYFSYNNYSFFNRESNLWLNYCFFFFENYETTYIRFKKRTADTIISPDLRLGGYKNFLNKYYNTFEFSQPLENFLNYNYLKVEFRPAPLRDVPLKISNLFKNFMENLKLNIIYKESPANLGLNFLFNSGYIPSNISKLENGLKFSLFNTFIFDNFLLEHNHKVYGSYYTRSGFKWFNNYEGYRMHNNFSTLFNINQIASKGMRYGHFKMDHISFYNNFNQENMSYKLDYLYDTLFFKNLQGSLVFNINDAYFNILKFYKI